MTLLKMAHIRALEQFNTRMPVEIWRWRDALINEHLPLVSDLVATYARDCRSAGGYKSANINLRGLDDALRVPVYTPLGIGLGRMASATMDNDELCDLAKQAADWCQGAVDDSGGDFVLAAGQCEEHCGDHGVNWPLKLTSNDTPEKIREKMLAALARVGCQRWWRRQLRRKYGRQVEQVLRSVGRVQKRKQPYVSDWAYKRWQHAQKRNRELLESMEAENELGEVVNLADAAASSAANPHVRHSELMVRMRGYEEIANDMDLARGFFTLTAPSKYHARHHYGPRNSNYNGATPDEVQEYLSQVWARIRARWAKRGIKPFGFRVVEPHHDGTPHWHLWLFFCGADVKQATADFMALACAEDWAEIADKPSVRAEVKWLEKGESATGYIAKYVSKNITGDNLGELGDIEGECQGKEGAKRATAWASMWGIRQFQQIGAISVTVWRELRRRGDFTAGGIDGLGDIPHFEAIREAADAGDWRAFVELMGGPQCKRKEQAIRPQQLPQAKPNAYGEEVDRLRGVIMRGAARFIRTRLHEWTVRRNGVQQESGPVQSVDVAELIKGADMGAAPVVGPSRSEMAHAEWRARIGSGAA